jgi:hypothetical protein
LLVGDIVKNAIDDVLKVNIERAVAIVIHTAHVVTYPVTIVSIEFPHAEQFTEIAINGLFIVLPQQGLN